MQLFSLQNYQNVLKPQNFMALFLIIGQNNDTSKKHTSTHFSPLSCLKILHNDMGPYKNLNHRYAATYKM